MMEGVGRRGEWNSVEIGASCSLALADREQSTPGRKIAHIPALPKALGYAQPQQRAGGAPRMKKGKENMLRYSIFLLAPPPTHNSN